MVRAAEKCILKELTVILRIVHHYLLIRDSEFLEIGHELEHSLLLALDKQPYTDIGEVFVTNFLVTGKNEMTSTLTIQSHINTMWPIKV